MPPQAYVLQFSMFTQLRLYISPQIGKVLFHLYSSIYSFVECNFRDQKHFTSKMMEHIVERYNYLPFTGYLTLSHIFQVM